MNVDHFLFSSKNSQYFNDFMSYSKQEKLQLAKQIPKWRSNQIKDLFFENDEGVIQVILENITDHQLKELKWPRETTAHIDKITFGSNWSADFGFYYTELSYPYQYELIDESLEERNKFLLWIKHASSRQIFIIMSYTKCSMHLRWILRNLTPIQKTGLKNFISETMNIHKEVLNNKNHWQFKALFVEISKNDSQFFQELVAENAKLLPAHILPVAIYFCPEALHSLEEPILENYFKFTSIEESICFLQECIEESKENLCKGPKTRCRFIFLFDLAVKILSSSEKWNAIEKELHNIKPEDQEDVFFSLALLEYGFTKRDSYYLTLYLEQLPSNPNICISLAVAYMHILNAPNMFVPQVPLIQYLFEKWTLSVEETLTILVPETKKKPLWPFISFLAEKHEELVINWFTKDILKTVSINKILSWNCERLDGNDDYNLRYLNPILSRKIFQRCQQEAINRASPE